MAKSSVNIQKVIILAEIIEKVKNYKNIYQKITRSKKIGKDWLLPRVTLVD